MLDICDLSLPSDGVHSIAHSIRQFLFPLGFDKHFAFSREGTLFGRGGAVAGGVRRVRVGDGADSRGMHGKSSNWRCKRQKNILIE